MKKNTLSFNDIEHIKEYELVLAGKYDPTLDGPSLKLGDVCIEERWACYKAALYTNKNCHGVVRKFKVVHVAPSGIYYLKEISIAGNLIGRLRLPPRLAVIANDDEGPSPAYKIGLHSRWTLDPGYLDAILLDQAYNPTAEIRENSSLYRDVHKHNNDVAVRGNINYIKAWMRNLKVGEVFWTSPSKFFTVQQVIAGEDNLVNVVAQDNQQVLQTFVPKNLCHRRLYRERPRSFVKEAKDP